MNTRRKPGLFSRIVLAAVVVFGGPTAGAQPTPRHLENVAFDQRRDRLVVYGGAAAVNGALTEFTQVHEWAPSGWWHVDAPGPGGRSGHAMVYDETQQAVLLIGGATEAVNPYVIYFDVWRWNGRDWQRLDANCPVKEPQAIYDPDHQRVLVYGDASDKTQFKYGADQRFELWAYRANRWEKLAAEGPHPDGPYQAAYDRHRHALVVLDWEGGNPVVWEWKAEAWSKTTATGPPPRSRYMLAHHPTDGRTYLYGGFTPDRQQLGDFWAWDGTAWTRLDALPTPALRNSAHFAFDGNRLLLYGGSVPQPGGAPGSLTVCNELWAWEGGIWKQLD